MKKQLTIILLSAFVVCMISACGSGNNENKGTQADSTATRQTASYKCPMHPEVKGDKPGTCEKCGMELEKE